MFPWRPFPLGDGLSEALDARSPSVTNHFSVSSGRGGNPGHPEVSGTDGPKHLFPGSPLWRLGLLYTLHLMELLLMEPRSRGGTKAPRRLLESPQRDGDRFVLGKREKRIGGFFFLPRKLSRTRPCTGVDHLATRSGAAISVLTGRDSRTFRATRRLSRCRDFSPDVNLTFWNFWLWRV